MWLYFWVVCFFFSSLFQSPVSSSPRHGMSMLLCSGNLSLSNTHKHMFFLNMYLLGYTCHHIILLEGGWVETFYRFEEAGSSSRFWYCQYCYVMFDALIFHIFDLFSLFWQQFLGGLLEYCMICLWFILTLQYNHTCDSLMGINQGLYLVCLSNYFNIFNVFAYNYKRCGSNW